MNKPTVPTRHVVASQRTTDAVFQAVVAVRASGLSKVDRLLAFELAAETQETGCTSELTLDELHVRTASNLSTLIQAKRRLIASGQLIVEQEGRRGRGTVYRLVLPALRDRGRTPDRAKREVPTEFRKVRKTRFPYADARESLGADSLMLTQGIREIPASEIQDPGSSGFEGESQDEIAGGSTPPGLSPRPPVRASLRDFEAGEADPEEEASSAEWAAYVWEHEQRSLEASLIEDSEPLPSALSDLENPKGVLTGGAAVAAGDAVPCDLDLRSDLSSQEDRAPAYEPGETLVTIARIQDAYARDEAEGMITHALTYAFREILDWDHPERRDPFVQRLMDLPGKDPEQKVLAIRLAHEVRIGARKPSGSRISHRGMHWYQETGGEAEIILAPGMFADTLPADLLRARLYAWIRSERTIHGASEDACPWDGPRCAAALRSIPKPSFDGEHERAIADAFWCESVDLGHWDIRTSEWSDTGPRRVRRHYSGSDVRRVVELADRARELGLTPEEAAQRASQAAWRADNVASQAAWRADNVTPSPILKGSSVRRFVMEALEKPAPRGDKGHDYRTPTDPALLAEMREDLITRLAEFRRRHGWRS
ncbi:MAG: hypothetical protein U0441_14820 [Polyangiaceae bacterium]